MQIGAAFLFLRPEGRRPIPAAFSHVQISKIVPWRERQRIYTSPISQKEAAAWICWHFIMPLLDDLFNIVSLNFKRTQVVLQIKHGIPGYKDE